VLLLLLSLMLACEPMPSIRWIITALLLGCCSLRLRNEMQRSTLQPNETVRKKRHHKSATRFSSSSALLVIAASTDDIPWYQQQLTPRTKPGLDFPTVPDRVAFISSQQCVLSKGPIRPARWLADHTAKADQSGSQAVSLRRHRLSL